MTEYGADPSGVDDSTAAVQSAVNAAAAAAMTAVANLPDGQPFTAEPTVWFPGGGYRLSSVVNLSRAGSPRWPNAR